ncbi:TerC family protein [Simkania sp.]|uniref:TerC family protein n=1 Tax=Simkania sp. TaxID=34094 RepID=UPI003B51D003
MLDQTFSLIDIPRLLTLTFLEGILSVDNALALALIVRHLPPMEKKKALFVGLISAMILRALGILAAAYLIQIFWIQLAGGAYLLYLACAHLLSYNKHKEKKEKAKKPSFWKVVILVELTDFAFAIDSILAGLALIGVHFTPPHLPPKIWIVYFGGIMGIILMRFAARLFTSLIDRYPGLELGAHLIVGWIGLKLILEASLKAGLPHYTSLPTWAGTLFWIGVIGFFLSSFFFKKKSSIDSNS